MTKQIMLLLSLMTVAGVSYAQVNDTVRVSQVWGIKRKVHNRKYILPIFSWLYELPKKRNVHFALI